MKKRSPFSTFRFLFFQVWPCEGNFPIGNLLSIASLNELSLTKKKWVCLDNEEN